MSRPVAHPSSFVFERDFQSLSKYGPVSMMLRIGMRMVSQLSYYWTNGSDPFSGLIMAVLPVQPRSSYSTIQYTLNK